MPGVVAVNLRHTLLVPGPPAGATLPAALPPARDDAERSSVSIWSSFWVSMAMWVTLAELVRYFYSNRHACRILELIPVPRR